eukprot:8265204-Pyramimonas_sp.AAC.1
MASVSDADAAGMLVSSSSARSVNAAANRLDVPGRRRARRSCWGAGCGHDCFGAVTLTFE